MQLTALQHRLRSFRHRRRLIRWGTAWFALAIAVLAILAALFAIDAAFELSVAQRLAILTLGGIAAIWTIRRFVLPWLGIHETETDVALFVEGQHGIDSDLVAALQFDRPIAEGWGSRELQASVVTRIASLSPQLDVTRGMNYRPFLRRSWLLAGMLLFAMVLSAIYPRYVAVFLSRVFLLSSRHYPSDTTIETINVNGTKAWEWNAASARPRDVYSAKNQPIVFVIQCTGELPESGRIECHSLLHDTSRTLPVRRLTESEIARRLPQSAANEKAAVAYYLAELPRLVEEFSYMLRMGDAWTDAAHIRMIEPPMVELAVRITPPVYAGAAETRPQENSSRHLSVLEGSRVDLELRSVHSMPQLHSKGLAESDQSRSSNGETRKPLKSATIKIESGGTVTSHAMVNAAGDGFSWSLPANTPLSSVSHELRYEIQVSDHDNMTLESPLRGFVELKIDRPPTVTASVVHRVVLPNAKPGIEYRMADDYGISKATLQGRIERQGDRADPTAASTESNADEPFEIEIPLDPPPRIGQNLPCRGKFELELVKFKLAKGDQVKLTLVAVDYRGDEPGEQQLSDPIILEVSDEAGVLSAITEADERSEKRLGDVIKQQLGVGGNK